MDKQELAGSNQMGEPEIVDGKLKGYPVSGEDKMNIEKYKFSDGLIEAAVISERDNQDLMIYIDPDVSMISLNKEDVRQLAIHFGLIKEQPVLRNYTENEEW